MLSNSLLIATLLLTFILQNPIPLLVNILIIIGIDYFTGKKIGKKIKAFKVIFLVYLFGSLIQIYYNQEGLVLLKIGGFYLTRLGIIEGVKFFLKITGLLFVSWSIKIDINSDSIFAKKFSRYYLIIQSSIELVPLVIKNVREIKGVKSFFRYILKQLRSKNDQSIPLEKEKNLL